MSNIIEKLGINKNWKFRPEYGIECDSNLFKGRCVIDVNSAEEKTLEIMLMESAPQMLEVLIECAELIGCFEVNENRDFRINEWLLPIIQKATGKTWEEIKELL